MQWLSKNKQWHKNRSSIKPRKNIDEKSLKKINKNFMLTEKKNEQGKKNENKNSLRKRRNIKKNSN